MPAAMLSSVQPHTRPIPRTAIHPGCGKAPDQLRAWLRVGIPCIAAVVASLFPAALQGFNNDGQTDLLWQNSSAHQVAVWFLDTTRFVDSGRITNSILPGWKIATTADFDRDGQTDLLLRMPETGQDEIWLMHGTNRITRQSIATGAPDYRVVGAGDFNNDGFPDILWHNQSRQNTAVWFMAGTNWTGSVGWIPRPEDIAGTGWEPAVTGDFDNDGNTDIVWRDLHTGRNIISYLSGTNLVSSAEIEAEPDLQFQLVAAGAFNRFGNTDLVWRHRDGRNRVWRMNGNHLQQTIDLPTEPDPNWQIAGTGGYTNDLPLAATPTARANRMRLTWGHGANRPVNISRRALGETKWELLSPRHTGTAFTDDTLQSGRLYEYQVGTETLLAGLHLAPVEYRGTALLVIDQSIETALQTGLEQFTTDLVGDGWSVVRTGVPRHNDDRPLENIQPIETLRSFIRQHATSNERNVVILLGHVPIPYSGFLNPDGHGARALPADILYGDLDGLYTDTTVNSISRLPEPRFERHNNIPGDGKFDQNLLPPNAAGRAGLELAVGRIDFVDLPAFKPLTEIDLLRRYLSKNHRWRHKSFVLPERVLAGVFFPDRTSPDTYRQASQIATRLFGAQPGRVVDGDPFDPATPALWGIHSGWGLPYGIRGPSGRYHEASDLARLGTEPRFAFAGFFGSYCVDWAYENSLLRAFLATPSYGLAATWFKPLPINRVTLPLDPLGTGEPIGIGFQRAVNQTIDRVQENTFISLQGDPTLRLQIIAPPTDLTVEPGSRITLKWAAPANPSNTYHVYRSTQALGGPWTRLTPHPIPTPVFTDPEPPEAPKLYQVRALALTLTGSASFTNLSQGIFIRVP
jgi:hypothetical protein